MATSSPRTPRAPVAVTPSSSSPERHEPLQMMILIAQLMIDHHETLRIVSKRQLPGHAYPAMQLDAFFRDPRADSANAVFRRRQRPLARLATGPTPPPPADYPHERL